jgi:hypothetical protein
MSHLCRHLALFLLAATSSLAAEAQTTIRFNGSGTTTGDSFNYNMSIKKVDIR